MTFKKRQHENKIYGANPIKKKTKIYLTQYIHLEYLKAYNYKLFPEHFIPNKFLKSQAYCPSILSNKLWAKFKIRPRCHKVKVSSMTGKSTRSIVEIILNVIGNFYCLWMKQRPFFVTSPFNTQLKAALLMTAWIERPLFSRSASGSVRQI